MDVMMARRNRGADPQIARGRGRLLSGVGVQDIFLLLYAVFCLFPIVWMIAASLKQQVDILASPKIIFRPTLDHYFMVLGHSDFPRYLANSLFVSFVSTIMGVLVGSLSAYSLARFRLRIDSYILFWTFFLRVVPPLALIVPFYLMLRVLHLLDTRLGLILVYTTINLPLSVWLMTGYFREVPQEIEEAALVDGCSRVGALFKILVPLSTPGLLATTVICLIFSWTEFPFALMLTSESAKTAPVSITSWLVERGLLWGELFASATLIGLPVLLFSLYAQRFLVRGLTLGAVKE